MIKKIVRFFSFIFFSFGAFYVYKAADLYFYQDKYVYHPEIKWKATPDLEGLVYEDLKLRSSDGIELSAWYVPSKISKGTVLFFHGNARNISSEIEALQMFNRFGYNVLALDYRGFGKSAGHPDEEGTYRDAQAAWDWLVSSKKESLERIVICGRSLGSGIAADLASKNKPKALILEAAFTSLPEAGQGRYPYFPVKLLSKYHYDTLSKLKKIHCPILIVHSRDDELIPFRHAERLYEAVTGKKEIVEIGGPHKGGYKPTLEKYHQGVKKFLDTYAG